jgi:hypothetical protein
MATGPEPFATEIKPDPIFQVASGFMAAKLLFVANAVGLFENLAKGQSPLRNSLNAQGFLSGRSAFWQMPRSL